MSLFALSSHHSNWIPLRLLRLCARYNHTIFWIYHCITAKSESQISVTLPRESRALKASRSAALTLPRRRERGRRPSWTRACEGRRLEHRRLAPQLLGEGPVARVVGKGDGGDDDRGLGVGALGADSAYARKGSPALEIGGCLGAVGLARELFLPSAGGEGIDASRDEGDRKESGHQDEAEGRPRLVFGLAERSGLSHGRLDSTSSSDHRAIYRPPVRILSQARTRGTSGTRLFL